MWRQTLALCVLFLMFCRIVCSNVRGLAGNLSDLTMASCSENWVSDMLHVSELLVPCFSLPVLLCLGKMPRARRMAACTRDGYGAFRQPKF